VIIQTKYYVVLKNLVKHILSSSNSDFKLYLKIFGAFLFVFAGLWGVLELQKKFPPVKNVNTIGYNKRYKKV